MVSAATSASGVAPPTIRTESNIAATVTSDGSIVRVYYQTSTGGVVESRYDGWTWLGGASSAALFQAAPSTPLAATTSDKGDTYIFYLNEQHAIRQFCHSACDGKWKPGADLTDVAKDPTPRTSLAAICFTDSHGVHIRLYYQKAESCKIQQLCYDGGRWQTGALLLPALDGTSIAAVSCYFKNPVIRVYYQTGDLTLHELCWDNISVGWYSGGFSPGAAPSHTPIAALGLHDINGFYPQVYSMSRRREIIQSKFYTKSSAWDYNHAVVCGPLPNCTRIAACQSGNGDILRLYYTSEDNVILEMRSGTAIWNTGSSILQA